MTARTYSLCSSVALAAFALAACRGTSSGIPTTAAPSLSRPPPLAAQTEEEQLDKLVAFTRLLGHLRYFHPTDEGATADWEALSIAAAPLVERARGGEELAAALRSVFVPVAPTVRIYAVNKALAPAPELTAPGGIPDPTFAGWVHRGAGLDTPQPLYSSVRVTNRASPHVAPGDLALSIPVTAVRGKRLRVKASARAELNDPHASAVLALYRVSHAGYEILASAPVVSSTWADIEIAGSVPDIERTGGVYVSLRLTGDGKAWIDDVSAAVDGDTAPLRLYDADFESAKAGEVPAGWEGDGADSHDYRTSASAVKPHKGTRCGLLESQPLPVERLPAPSKTLHADLGAGVEADVPLSLYVDGQGRTLPVTSAPHTPPAPMRERQFRDSANDRAVRLADVALAWNVLEHFYPYFDVVAVDWHDELRTALRSAMRDTNAQAFRTTLMRLVAALHDGHGFVSRVVPGPKGKEAVLPRASLPVGWRLIERRLVVTDVGQAAGDIRPGDVVVSIDGVPALESVAAAAELVSAATPQFRMDRATLYLLWGPEGDDVPLTLQRGASPPFATRLRYAGDTLGRARTKPEKVAEVAPRVMYLDLDRITDADFEAALPKITAGRGVIFDVRGYPRQVSPRILQHLTDRPLRGPFGLVPKALRPDRDGVILEDRERLTLAPLVPRIRGNVVFLTDARALSYAETYLGIVEAYQLGAIVGETTGGTNGNINSFGLPGGFRITFTGMKTVKHDGSTHHGVGIAPTLPCAPTIAGVTAGRDEVLECGVAAATRP